MTSDMRVSRSFLLSYVLICFLTVLTGCSTLPTRQTVTPSYIQQIDTSQTYLSRLFSPQKQQHPDLTGYHILFDPSEAIISRLQLIERAEKSLDLQYYIWDNDKIGVLALAALLKAADRGVQVRLLIDDNNSKDLEAAYHALDQHPNIQIRLFNPYRFRQLRVLDLAFNFNRMTRRMHNKTFIADHQIALIGGRNMSNQYYNSSESFQFSDMDVVLVGKAVEDISESFDEYWNHDYAYPVAQLSAYKSKKLSYQSVRKQIEDHWFISNLNDEMGILSSALKFDSWFNQDLDFEWVTAKVVKDSANKIKHDTAPEDYLSFQLKSMLSTPQKNIDLVSAYFVPEQQGVETIIKRKQEGVNIRILTNSFKANDVPIVHAFYSQYREDLLKNGIELYEFLPVLPMNLSRQERQDTFGKDTKFNRSGLSRSSLHAKFMAQDSEQVFIGSFNFDPRSAYLNTEIGVVLNSPTLAAAIHNNMDQNIMDYAYKLELNEQNKIQWIKKEGEQKVIFNTEPKTAWWQRIGLKMLSWLPIEKQM